MTTFELSIVIPVKNEAENIEGLTGEIHSAIGSSINFELIYVDDGSDDSTFNLLGDICDRYPVTRVIRHQVSCGQSRAIHTGIVNAAAPWIATLDGDGQNDPADILSLWKQLDRTGPAAYLHAVAGHRTRRKDSVTKRFTSRVANAVRSRILRDKTPDTGCGLKIFSRELFLMLPYFDHMHRFLPALIRRHGGEVISIAVNHRPRQKGTTKYGTWDRLAVGIPDLLGVLWLTRRCQLPTILEGKDSYGN
ncbi:MAG: glycosyltransferase [Gammaproteobacteria bacterium]|nr:glycosyltransferase [Gammaproteobacteria bacterium]